eukprot:TRINITY_DN447_c0_g1_i1.p1 TRINITY_DN447_c0_g1~~TRINITY_DN447_c0_g1_i1.p1  ORF type:complete len:202 (-),score=37.50 TRINITY_DN447_c0_g1_i1:143-748(-)
MSKLDSKDKKPGVTVRDVPAEDFIVELAKHFKEKGKLELPEWHDYVKTSITKEMGPLDPDWYFVRAASLTRKVYLRGGTGIGAFARVYGGRKRRNTKGRNHFQRSATGVIRYILKQLASLGLVEKQKEKRGRFITKSGQKLLDTIASQASRGHGSKGDGLTLPKAGAARIIERVPVAAPAQQEEHETEETEQPEEEEEEQE